MSAAVNTLKLSRELYPWEKALAAPIFGAALRLERVRIHEFSTWPNTLDDLGRKLKRMAPRPATSHNAITLFNGCYFPLGFPFYPPDPLDAEYYKTAWLMHELTHCWQFQTLGARYLWLALRAQFSQGANVYTLGGVANLTAKRQKEHWSIFNFNLEQQGEIVRSFYLAGADLPQQQPLYEACLPYIQDIQASR